MNMIGDDILIYIYDSYIYILKYRRLSYNTTVHTFASASRCTTDGQRFIASVWWVNENAKIFEKNGSGKQFSVGNFHFYFGRGKTNFWGGV